MIRHMIAYFVKTEDSKATITDSYGNTITSNNPDELWSFLYTPYRDKSTRELKFFWDLDESLSHIFKLMPPEEAKKLLTTKFPDTDYVYYRRSKNLIIKGDHPTGIGNNKYMACIYGLNPLIKNAIEPQNAQEVLAQGQRLLTALEHIGITTPLTLNSSIGIYESSMRNIRLTPDIKCIPTDAVDILNYAKHCANRQGWITAYKVGHFTNAFTYDVSGSYAYWLSQIRDFKNAEYIPYTKEYAKQNQDDILKGNITGFFKVELTIKDDIKVHPFAYVSKIGLPIYPTGTFETYLTLEEMLYFNHYKLGTAKIIDGWFVKFLSSSTPMCHIVNRLFEERGLGETENDLCKGILVGYVGKMNAQFEGDTTSKTYNPMIAGWIYAQARLQVFKFIMENELQDDIIAVSTDGVMTTKEAAKADVSTKKRLGTWRLNEPCPALVLSPGWIIYQDKKPHSITYDMAMRLIKDNPSTNHYRATVPKRVTLFEAIEILHDINMVGRITDHHNTIDLAEIEMAQDRIFKSFPKTGKALLSGTIYDSKPIKV